MLVLGWIFRSQPAQTTAEPSDRVDRDERAPHGEKNYIGVKNHTIEKKAHGGNGPIKVARKHITHEHPPLVTNLALWLQDFNKPI